MRSLSVEHNLSLVMLDCEHCLVTHRKLHLIASFQRNKQTVKGELACLREIVTFPILCCGATETCLVWYICFNVMILRYFWQIITGT